jgi:hypothetical protein
MPKVPRPGRSPLYVEVPEGLLALLRERADRERRPMTTTVIIALEQYLGVGPGDYETPAAKADAPPAKPRRPRGV